MTCSRSMRGRPGSLKAKNQYTTLKENGDVGTGLTSAKRTDDFDIKTLQQKKHEAEIKRSVTEIKWLRSHKGQMISLWAKFTQRSNGQFVG
jgi:hypothetical protein